MSNKCRNQKDAENFGIFYFSFLKIGRPAKGDLINFFEFLQFLFFKFRVK